MSQLISTSFAAFTMFFGGGDQPPPPLTIEQALNIQIEGQRPQLVVMVKSGEGDYETRVAAVAAPRYVPHADSRPTPVWSVRLVRWTRGNQWISESLSQSSCPALMGLLETFATSWDVDLEVPTEALASRQEVPAPPAKPLHQSFQIWGQGRDPSGESVILNVEGLAGETYAILSARLSDLEDCIASS